jgi:hypothetical protein
MPVSFTADSFKINAPVSAGTLLEKSRPSIIFHPTVLPKSGETNTCPNDGSKPEAFPSQSKPVLVIPSSVVALELAAAAIFVGAWPADLFLCT